MEITQKLQDSARPILEQQEKIRQLTEPIRLNLPDTSVISPATEAINAMHAYNPLLHDSALMQAKSAFSNYQINSGLLETVTQLNNKLTSLLSNQISAFVNNMSSAIITAVQSPMMQWLQSFDFTSVWDVLKDIDPLIDYSDRYKELNEAYLSAMYECKWFPYAGWISDISLFSTISEIISSSRGASKRREQRIDKAILSYYTKAELKNIKRQWKNTELEPHMKKILGQAVEAHIRGEYVLTISCLATMWEGMIKSKITEVPKPSKEDIQDLVDENGFDKIFSDFYNNMIISTCYSVDDVVEGVPNRHGVAHSWYVKYPTRKASLNAILLTDFIINLKPKEVSEENYNE